MALRKEIKYVVPIATAFAVRESLDKLLERDPHGTDGAYTIRSLYFDTIDNSDFWEKIAGVEIRKKIRLRIYDGNAALCKLETKQKYGELQDKESFVIQTDHARALSRGEIGVLRNYFQEIPYSIDLYAIMSRNCYRPVVQIEYDRYAYQYPMYDTRITLDMNVRSSESNMDIFTQEDCFIPIMPDQVVLEVKYNEKIMGFISNMLGQFDLIQESYSKYCSGRRVYYDFME